MPSVENVEVDINNTISTNIQDIILGNREVSNNEIIDLLEHSRSEFITILTLEIVPKFINSSYFKEWRDNECNRAVVVTKTASDVNVTIPEMLTIDTSGINKKVVQAEAQFANLKLSIDEIDKNVSDDELKESNIIEARPIQNTINNENDDVIDKTIKYIDYLEVDRILRSGNYKINRIIFIYVYILMTFTII
jgi:hypothetical protein